MSFCRSKFYCSWPWGNLSVQPFHASSFFHLLSFESKLSKELQVASYIKSQGLILNTNVLANTRAGEQYWKLPKRLHWKAISLQFCVLNTGEELKNSTWCAASGKPLFYSFQKKEANYKTRMIQTTIFRNVSFDVFGLGFFFWFGLLRYLVVLNMKKEFWISIVGPSNLRITVRKEGKSKFLSENRY